MYQHQRPTPGVSTNRQGLVPTLGLWRRFLGRARQYSPLAMASDAEVQTLKYAWPAGHLEDSELSWSTSLVSQLSKHTSRLELGGSEPAASPIGHGGHAYPYMTEAHP